MRRPKHIDLTGGRIKGLFHIDLEARLLCAGTMIGEIEALLDEGVAVDGPMLARTFARLFEAEQQRTHELGKSLEDLRTTQDRLVQTQKLASLGQLTAGIAHEIKNPLNFVNNFSGVSAELIDELREALGRMTGDDKTRREIVELSDTLRDNLARSFSTASARTR